MAIHAVHCSVLGSEVMRVTDLEGQTTRIICPEFESPEGTCRRMREAQQGGPLSQLLERASEHTLRTRDVHCILR
jgi:hypothetical protein